MVHVTMTVSLFDIWLYDMEINCFLVLKSLFTHYLSVLLNEDPTTLLEQQAIACKLSPQFICLDRFCRLWTPLIITYKYLTAFLRLASLSLTRNENKNETIKHTTMNE